MHSEQKAIIYTSLERSIYIGRLERILKRTNVVSTLLISLEKDLELLDESNTQITKSKSFLIPAGMNLSIDTHDSKVCLCFLDDLGTDLSKLIPQMKTTITLEDNQHLYSDIVHEAAVAQYAINVANTKPPAKKIFEQFDKWHATTPPGKPLLFDKRVASAIALIKKHYDKNISVTELAKQVNLSVPRLTQLFKQVTGTPIRRFRLWYRIFATASKLNEGYSLTEAAINSGFSDYAQFSRVYRELSGASPAAAKNNTEIRIYKAAQPRLAIQ